MSRKKVILLSLAALAVGATSFPYLRLAWFEHKARQLCAVDGGFHIYEEVQIPSHSFTKDGVPILGRQGKENPENAAMGFTREADSWSIYGPNPKVFRLSSNVKRDSDKKILGEYVYYGVIRSVPSIFLATPSLTVCPSSNDSRYSRNGNDLLKLIFKKVN